MPVAGLQLHGALQMSKSSQAANIVKVKTDLADKYLRLAQKRSSKPARARLLRHAERFRQQAAVAKRAR
jgi:hypothetical protein